jgi:hypothetical protein
VRPTLIAALLLCGLTLPAPAYAWWGWLEKMSGPSGLNGPQFEVRVLCFGDRHDEVQRAESLAAEARRLTRIAEAEEAARRNPDWRSAGDRWLDVATAWAVILDEPVPDVTSTGRERALDLRSRAESRARRGRAQLIATSSAGVMWSLCAPDRRRRLALDVSWGVWENDGDTGIANGEHVELQTLMTSVSWRLFPETKLDFFDLSAGGGAFWFSSQAFPSKSGVVVQPIRLTIRAPASWSAPPPDDPRRWLKHLAAIPVFGIGLTVFPGGFEPAELGTSTRIPRELLTTRYFFVNLEPLVQLARR